MGLKSFIQGLAGSNKSDGGDSKQGEAVSYQGYVITPIPQSADGQFRIAGSIVKAGDSSGAADVNDSTNPKVHEFIRADLTGSWEDACTMSVDKAKRIIDERGDAIFS